jgi:nitrite reductase/ring-hydroxylating ferredoxin subunit
LLSNGSLAVALDDDVCKEMFIFLMLVFRTKRLGTGKVYCLSGRCSHAGAPLAEGTLDGKILTCPWHYSQFNITNGQVVRGPAYKPLKAYVVEEKENSIYIDL